jgi:uncharacterized protein YfaP (DUF2135 family)
MKSICKALLLNSLLLASIAHAGQIEVQILSATVKDQKIANASVTLQRNGEQSIVGLTGSEGKVQLQSGFPDDSATIMIVKKAGFSNLVVKCPCVATTYAISPVMRNLDGLRVVLNWGVSPVDLDSHLVFPGNHVYFVNQKGADANLDVDDTTSFGPETITIERKHAGERYIYAVHDYSNRGNSNSIALANSGAKVFVYVGQTLIRTYDVPKAKVGNLWAVFAVSNDGDFQDYNVIKSVQSEERLGLAEFEGAMKTSPVQNLSASVANQDAAQAFNRDGETAYHAKNYDEAIRLFQAAIEADGHYGQAFSNLGLVFQKAGRVSEALWANRKAIALASGATANTVRASAHYNNGKIYQAAAQWADALREFQLAKQEKANVVYDQSILRMQQKIRGAR